ncbi:sensor histidine kinase [Paenibacillus koleovorans]|uniref:sensor histidine kinase n=1 Tax=Paenibacillus koleovorans TaxID=121608 RepID=UPI000FD95E77|nr:ATP-binding protein [Paenibacillus koleovorans]
MKKKSIWILIVLVLITVQSWFFYLTFRYPHTGIVVEQNEKSEWVIEDFEMSKIGEDLDLRVGDIVLEIDRKPTDEHPSIRKFRTVDQADTLLISRNGETFEANILQIRSSVDYLSIIGETTCLAIAGILLTTLRGSPSATFLAGVFINIGLIFMSLLASIRGDSTGKVLINSLMMLLPVMFYHFLLEFFKEKGGIATSKKLLVPLYAIVIASFLLRFSFYFPDIAFDFYFHNNTVTISFFLIGILLNFYMMTKLLIKHWSTGDTISMLIKTVWISFLLSFMPFAFLSFLPLLIFGHPFISTYFSGWMFMIFPLSFAYLIGTRQLYDIHIVLRRLMMTGAISVFPSTILVAFIWLIFQQHATARHLSFVFCFTLVLLTVLLYALEHFSTKLEWIMFPRKYVLQTALKKIARNLGNITSFREIKDIILVDIVSTLRVYGGALVFRYREDMELIEVGEINLGEVEQLVRFGVMEHPFYLIHEVNRHEEYTSYLITTRKMTNTLLGQEEVQWLNLIISYLSVSLENIFLIRKLTLKLEQLAAQMPSEQLAKDLDWFRKLMFELQEKERSRIATDIHDTTMQDLFFLKRRLNALTTRYISNDEDREQMIALSEYVDIINANLRQSCFELHPHLLQEIGLLQTVHKLVEQERASCPFAVELKMVRAGAIEHKDLETKRHIFRVVQELLNNAKKHSLAEKVSLHLSVVHETFYLLYEDNGIGFEPAPAPKETGTAGIGLEQMRTRILHLNGNMELESSRGNGVKIWITMPLKEGITA